jgi:hypothetical protein
MFTTPVLQKILKGIVHTEEGKNNNHKHESPEKNKTERMTQPINELERFSLKI